MNSFIIKQILNSSQGIIRVIKIWRMRLLRMLLREMCTKLCSENPNKKKQFRRHRHRHDDITKVELQVIICEDEYCVDWAQYRRAQWRTLC